MRPISLIRRVQETGSIAEPILALRDGPNDTYPEGRVCRDYDCETLLSIYNEGTYCALHDPKMFRPTRVDVA